MTAKKSSNRFFIIFSEEDKGFGAADRQPAGYVRVDIKSGRCRLCVYIQNLSCEKGPYNLYFLSTSKEKGACVKLGELRLDDTGTGETYFEYDERDIAGSNIGIESFNVAALVADRRELLSPLVGYHGKDKVIWKEYFIREGVTAPVQAEEKAEPLETEEIKRPEHELAEEAEETSVNEDVSEAGTDADPEEQALSERFREYELGLREMAENNEYNMKEFISEDTRDIPRDGKGHEKPEEEIVVPEEPEEPVIMEMPEEEVKPAPCEEHVEPEKMEAPCKEPEEEEHEKEGGCEFHKLSHLKKFMQILKGCARAPEIEEKMPDTMWWELPEEFTFTEDDFRMYPYYAAVNHIKSQSPCDGCGVGVEDDMAVKTGNAMAYNVMSGEYGYSKYNGQDDDEDDDCGLCMLKQGKHPVNCAYVENVQNCMPYMWMMPMVPPFINTMEQEKEININFNINKIYNKPVEEKKEYKKPEKPKVCPLVNMPEVKHQKPKVSPVKKETCKEYIKTPPPQGTGAVKKPVKAKKKQYFGIKHGKGKCKRIMYGIEGGYSREEYLSCGNPGFYSWLPLKESGLWLMFCEPATGKVIYPK